MRRLVIVFFCFICCGFYVFAESSIELTWDALASVDVDQELAAQDIVKFDQQSVYIAGFIVPLDFGDDFYTVTELLLVPDPLSCIHVPPPPPNQMVHVVLEKAIPVDMDLRGVQITGIFQLTQDHTDYGDIYYKLIGKEAIALDIDYEDPFEAFYDDDFGEYD